MSVEPLNSDNFREKKASFRAQTPKVEDASEPEVVVSAANKNESNTEEEKKSDQNSHNHAQSALMAAHQNNCDNPEHNHGKSHENLASLAAFNGRAPATQLLVMSMRSDNVVIKLKAIRDLIEKGADIKVIDADGNSMLHWSVWKGEWEITQFMIAHGVSTNIRNNLGQTCLHWASMSGDIRSAKLILDAGKTPKNDKNDDKQQQNLNQNQNHQQLSVMDQDIDGYTSLHAAAQFNQTAMLEFFKFYYFSIHTQNDGEMEEKKHNDDNHDGDDDDSASQGYLIGGEMDLSAVDAKGRGLVHWAAFKQYTIVLEWLISNHAPLGIVDATGDTALHICAKHNCCAALTLLLQNNQGLSMIQVLNEHGESPLDLAQRMEFTECTKLLKDAQRYTQNVNHNGLLICSLFDIWTNDEHIVSNEARRLAKNTKIFLWTFAVLWLVFELVFLSPVLNDIDDSDIDSDGIGSYLLELVLWGFALMSSVGWIIVHRSDPGFIPKPSTPEELSRLFIHGKHINNNNNSNEEGGVTGASSADHSSLNSEGGGANSANNSSDMDGNGGYIDRLIKGDIKKICVTCRVVKTGRSKHCPICKRCVSIFDHHCPWIDNCVGQNNYRQFFIWCVILTLAMLHSLMMIVLKFIYSDDLSVGVIIAGSLFGLIIVVLVTFSGVQVLSHCLLITQGLTTNEKINRHRYSQFHIRQPKPQGSTKNESNHQHHHDHHHHPHQDGTDEKKKKHKHQIKYVNPYSRGGCQNWKLCIKNQRPVELSKVSKTAAKKTMRIAPEINNVTNESQNEHDRNAAKRSRQSDESNIKQGKQAQQSQPNANAAAIEMQALSNHGGGGGESARSLSQL